MKWCDKYAAKVGISVNPDAEHADMILAGLEARKTEHGARYCPCVPQWASTKDNICPCKDLRASLERGEVDCRCGLFVPRK